MKADIAILLLSTLLHVVTCEDLYQTLGVSRRSSSADIRRAYRQLAREWHPDKNKGNGAEEKFIQINKAYEVLSDERKKREYDMFGTTDEQEQRFPFGGHRHPHQHHQQFQQFFVFRGGRPHHFFQAQRQPSIFDGNLMLVLVPLLFLMIFLPLGGDRGEENVRQNLRQRQQQQRHSHSHAGQPDERDGSGTADDQTTVSTTRLCARLDDDTIGSIERLPGGHFVLVLLVEDDPEEEENDSDALLLQAFLDTTEVYQRNSRYHLMYLVLSQHAAASWCDMLDAVLDSAHSEVISTEGLCEWRPGVVLALNPHRFYLSVFKPIEEGQERVEDDSANDFLGVSSPDWRSGLDSHSGEHAAAARVSSDLRTRLPLWLDRHSDGSVPRLRVSTWPTARED